MIEHQEMTLQTTQRRTLWSETLVEMLYDAVESDWSGYALREILIELHHKGYKLDKVAKMVNKKYGREAAARLLAKIRK